MAAAGEPLVALAPAIVSAPPDSLASTRAVTSTASSSVEKAYV